ncbi:hypothetical protein ACFQ36_17805 [Arthrobacter sp. GCM10027362]|uniref:hypothetical protein n=1 Tax=Arthrobacter sp. GCM10027362 TaxID=3273379 RepID=UPI003644B956
MDETNPLEDSAERPNTQRQLAIFEVARRARGRTMPEIKRMLLKAFSRRRLPGPQETWLDAVASEASYGQPYIVDLPAAEAAARSLEDPGPQPGGTTGTGRPRARRRAAPDRNEGLAAVRAIVAGAIALTAAAAVVMIIRAGRRPGP